MGTDINSFVEEYTRQINRLTDNINPSDLQLIKTNIDRLKKIEQLLSIRSFRLVFIGSPGAGKTTTICNYLNLIDDNIIGKPTSQSIELFNVREGRTTAFEVHYKISGDTCIHITPLNPTIQEMIIREYCETRWSGCFPEYAINPDESNTSESGIEHYRIIRNMFGVKNDADLNNYISQNYSPDEFDGFYSDVLRKISLDNRNRKQFCYSGDGSPKKWIKDTFNGINYGLFPDVSIPERVDISINPQDLPINLPSFISEVVDTRGFEGNTREDLRQYINSDDTIIVMLDRTTEVPGERLKRILQDWILKEDKDIIPRVCLFVKFRDDELEKVNEADGDEEKGEEIKREEIRTKVISDKLNYQPDNTLFLDSYRWIITKKIIQRSDDGSKQKKQTVVDDCDIEQWKYDHERITKHFEGIINRFQIQLSEEAAMLKSDIANLYSEISAPSLNKQFATFLQKVIVKIQTIKDSIVGTENTDGAIEKEFSDFSSKFCTRFRERCHWQSVRKTTSLAGTWYKAQIYDDVKLFVSILARNVVEKGKDMIKGYLSAKEYSDLEPFLNSCCQKIDQDYINLLETISKKAHDIMVDAFTKAGNDFDHNSDWMIIRYKDSECWSSLTSVERGSGYYIRLMEAYRRRMGRKRIDVNMQDMIYDEITSYIDSIINLLQNKIGTL